MKFAGWAAIPIVEKGRIAGRGVRSAVGASERFTGNMNTSRRSFLKGVGLATSAMFLSSKAWANTKGANSKFRVAIVGVGGRGDAAVGSLMSCPEAKVVAFCDVDDRQAAKNYKKYPDVPRFRDYRVMLDKMGKQIDGVAVCTPDHMHFPICAWAIANGKHVFCEKPLARTIWETRELKRLAKEAGVFTQMGNQGHSMEGWRNLREWTEAGILGEIEDIYCWTDRAIWPQGESLKIPAGEPVPPEVDYNLWLGVAPYQPYNRAILPFAWRGLRNYGTGAAGDMACHFLDVPYSGLELGMPDTIVGNADKASDYSWPKSADFVMTFTNKFGKDGKIRLHWFDGGRKPKEIKRVPQQYFEEAKKRNGYEDRNQTFIVGTKNTMTGNFYGATSILFPREKMRDALRDKIFPEKKIPRSVAPGNPHAEWAKCCVAGVNPPANFDYSAPFTEFALLGMVSALLPGRELKYDSSTMTFPNCPEANAFTKSLYNYRKEFLPSAVKL